MIIYIVDQFPSASEYFILNEVKEIAKRKTAIHLLALRRGETNYKDGDIEVTYASRLYDFSLVKAHLFVLRKYWKRYFQCLRPVFFPWKKRVWYRIKAFVIAVYFVHHLHGKSASLIHAHFLSLPSAIAVIISGLLGIPFSSSAHAADVYTSDPGEIAERVNAASFVVTCTSYNRDYLQRLPGIHNRGRIFLNYHGLDLGRWQRTKHQYGIASGSSLHLLTVCRLVKKKGLSYLLQAMKMVQERGYEVSLTIVGDGPLLDTLQQEAESLGIITCVHFAGALPQEEIREFYALADMFVLPCIVTDNGDRDGIPNVLVEALACGLPAISTNISGISELLSDGETGLMVHEKDAIGLAAAICRLTDDIDLRMRLADNGRKFLEENLSIAKSIDSLDQLFTEYGN